MNQDEELWVLDSTGRHVRLDVRSNSPVWSADGTEVIAWHRDMGPVRQLVQTGSRPSALEDVSSLVTDWSSDSRWLLMMATNDGSVDLLVHDMQERTTSTWLATDADEMLGRFSPDARWVAYVSNASGRPDVYVRPLDGDGPAVAVSIDGGTHPAWRGDGGELYYLGADGSIMASALDTSEDRIEPGRPQALFRTPLNDISIEDSSPYDVAPDGQRFLLNVPDGSLSLLLVQGWEDLLEGR